MGTGESPLPPTADGPALHFQRTRRDPHIVPAPGAPPALCHSRDGVGAVAVPGDAAGWQQGWLQEPAGFHPHRPISVWAAPCGAVAQPRYLGFGRRHRVLGACLWDSYQQLSEQFSFCISNPPPTRSSRLCTEMYWRAPSKTTPDY